MKDPAFLFYSKDFYEGTRMMLPEERACYIDLMIYQHQNGIIPDNTKRLLMYCSGVDEATLEATLEAKFKKTEKGWVNKRLEGEILHRENYKKDLSVSGRVGQFWKKSKNILSNKDYIFLRKNIDRQLIIDFLNDNKTIDNKTLEGWLKGSLKGGLSNKANANANANAIIGSKEGGTGETSEGILPIEEMREELKQPNTQAKEARMRMNKISEDEHDRLVDYFIDREIGKDKTGVQRKQTIEHFGNWLPVEIKKSKSNGKQGKFISQELRELASHIKD